MSWRARKLFESHAPRPEIILYFCFKLQSYYCVIYGSIKTNFYCTEREIYKMLLFRYIWCWASVFCFHVDICALPLCCCGKCPHSLAVFVLIFQFLFALVCVRVIGNLRRTVNIPIYIIIIRARGVRTRYTCSRWWALIKRRKDGRILSVSGSGSSCTPCRRRDKAEN